MTTSPPPKNTKNLVAHVFATVGYSLAGGRFLMQQRAARLQVFMCAVTIVVFAVVGVALPQWLIMLCLFAASLATEALNTAIELIIDRTSPEISEYAKNAKDLGSFAVFCAILVFIGHALWAVAGVMLSA